MGFVSCYSKSEKYVELTREVLCGGLFPGWEKNGEKTGVDLVHPLFVGGCEVKADFKAHITGNCFFEWECSGKPSGLRKYENLIFWAQWVDATSTLYLLDARRLSEELPKASRWLEGVGDGNASGWLCKMELVERLAFLKKVLPREQGTDIIGTLLT